jgi:hypothetical protein
MELMEAGKQVSLPDEYINDRLTKEEQDAKCALGWFQAWSQIPTSAEHGTFLDFLNRPYWQDLGSELLFVYKDAAHFSAARYDRLLYHKEKNELWIVDFKTTDTHPDVRAQICPIESASFLYPQILSSVLSKLGPANCGDLLGFELPKDVQVGGMIHLIVQKPSIEFSREDRPYKEVQHELKSGPRKGQVEIRKEFTSDIPDLNLYVDRCGHWLSGTGTYLDKSAERAAHPSVNISFTSHALLRSNWSERFVTRYELMQSYSTCPCDPSLFPMNASGLLDYGKLNPLAPFYLTPQSGWEEIMQRNYLIQKFRDPEITPDSETTIVPSTPGVTA